eukprot:CAMPEP_0172404744 /NCGR_PEP_ID=MMETSP1061-20121228/64215_1 /TAXON_ID=37318 /ORGANISM="Pseudo-nitzschia pungens, Strain cf. pungens" /LENGTH=37 /DNA_ID= /DNA_START= /DNA_END= /DNA_ORIENTATION=
MRITEGMAIIRMIERFLLSWSVSVQEVDASMVGWLEF